MLAALALLLTGSLVQDVEPRPAAAARDTVRLEVGSPEVDGGIYRPHAARVTVRVGAPDGPVRAEWTNVLTLGDSAGRRVMRWVTRGTRTGPDGAPLTWEIHQTYDARTLAPYGYLSRASTGACTRLAIDGTRVRGVRRLPGDSAAQRVDVALDRAGFVASASDLVPLAAGLRAGKVMTAPVWGPAMQRAEGRVFTVIGEVPLVVEGDSVRAWKVEERKEADGPLTATWYLTEASPYMVYGEVPLPDGRMQYMSEVEIPAPAAEPEDLYHAAWLLDHGDHPDEARRAHELAREAAERGWRPARWLAAAAYDRWCMYEGRPQRWGTQFVPDGVRHRLWDVDPATTDEERAAWDVPPLAEQLARAEELTRGEPQPPMAHAPAWLRAAIARWRDAERR